MVSWEIWDASCVGPKVLRSPILDACFPRYCLWVPPGLGAPGAGLLRPGDLPASRPERAVDRGRMPVPGSGCAQGRVEGAA